MSSIKIRVEDLIGSVGDDTAIGDWATDGARAVINVVPDSALWSFSSDHTDSGSGIAVDTLKVLGAHKDGYEAIEYPPNMKGRLASSNSIHKATTTSPAFYKLNGKVYVLPSGGTVVAVSIPTITSSTTAIASFPDEAEHVVILYTAVQGKLRQLTDKRTNLPSDLNLAVIPTSPSLDLSMASALSDISYSSPTAPTQPNTPNITSSDASATGISQQTISIGTAPSYMKAILSLVAAPTISDLDLSAGGKNVVISTDLPTVPDFNSQLMSASNISAQTVSFSEPAPTYIKPSFNTPALASIADLDISTAFSKASNEGTSAISVTITGAPPLYSKPVLSFTTFPSLTWTFPTFPVAPNTGAQTVDDYSTEAPTYIQPTLSLSTAPTISDLTIGAEIPVSPTLSASTDVDTSGLTAPTYMAPVVSLTGFPSLSWTMPVVPILPSINAESSSTGGVEVDTAKLATAPVYTPPVMNTPDFSDANTWITDEEDSEMLASRVQMIQAQIGEYQAKLAESQAEFNEDNAEYQAKLQIAMQDASLANTGDSTKIQKFSGQVSIYSAEIGSIIQSNQGEMSAWQQENSLVLQKHAPDIQNALNAFNKENVEYQALLQVEIQNAQLTSRTDGEKLQKYQSEVGKYSADVGKEVQEYTQNLQKELQLWQVGRQTDLQKYGSDIQNALNSFNEENSVYQSTFQEKVKEADLKDAEENRKIQIFQSELNKYQQKINKVVSGNQAQIAEWEQENTLNLQKYNSDIQNELNAFNMLNVEYQAKLQKDIMDAQLSDKEEARALQEFQIEVSKYQTEVNAEIQRWTVEDFTPKMQEWQTEYSSRLQRFSVDIQSALNSFDEKNIEYQAKLQIAVQDTQLAQESVIQNANLETDVDKQNKMLELKRQLDEYSSKLQRYSSDVQRYQSEVSTEVQLYTINEIQKEMALWQEEQSQKLDKYAKDIQDNLNSFNEDNVKYQADLQKSITQSQLDVQRLTEVASQADSIDLQNKANTLQALIQDYQLELSRYSTNVQRYGLEQSDSVNTMQVAIQKRASELQELAQLNQDKLAKYSQEIQAYGSETQLEIQDYTSKVQRYSQEHQLMLAELQVLQQQYQQGLQFLAGIPRNQEGNN